MNDEPVYTLGDALNVCMEDAWTEYAYDQARSKTRTWIRQNKVAKVSVDVTISFNNESGFVIKFLDFRGREVYLTYWPLVHVGPDLYKIPVWHG